jgi:AraC-like DNA-binding protein
MKYFYKGDGPLWPHPLELYVRDVNFFRYNWHHEYEFLLLLEGEVSFCTDGKSFAMREGDVFLVNSNKGHAMVSQDKESTALVLRFAPEYFSDLEPSFRKIEIECVSTPKTRNESRLVRLRQYAAQMMLAAGSSAPGSRFTLRGAFNMLLGELLADFPVTSVEPRESPRDRKNMKTIRNVTDWLEKNYDRKIALEDAAKVARYNRTYFSSFFRRNVGIPFYDYLTRIRFRHALYQLNNTGHSLTDIAADCGFPDLKTFSSYYKRLFGEPPVERRRSIDTSSFTQAEESERIFLDMNAHGIEEKLRAFAQLIQNEPTPSAQPENNRHQELDRIAELCGQILTIAQGKQ